MHESTASGVSQSRNAKPTSPKSAIFARCWYAWQAACVPISSLRPRPRCRKNGARERAGGAERRREEADDPAGRDHARARLGRSGGAEAQPLRPPRRDEHERTDRELAHAARHGTRDGEAGVGERQERQREAREQRPAHVRPLRDAPRRVRDELHDGVYRDRDLRLEPEQHDREERHAARHADDRGERPRRDRRRGEDREDVRLDHACGSRGEASGPVTGTEAPGRGPT